MNDASAAKGTKIMDLARREPALFLTGIAAALCVVALFTPWWTAKVELGAEEESGSARPFDQGDFGGVDMIKDGEADTAGLLTLVALAGLGGGAYLLWVARRTSVPAKPFVALLILGGAASLGLALVLAVTTWPSEETDVSFWDTKREALGEATATVTLQAGLGWYLAAVGVVAGLVGGVKARMPVAVAGTVPPVAGAAPAAQPPYVPPPGFPPPASPYPPMAGPVAYAPPPPPGFGAAPTSPRPLAPVPGPVTPPPPPLAPAAGHVPSSVPVSTPHQPGLQFQCPRCGARIESPPYRPAELICPACQFRGVVTA